MNLRTTPCSALALACRRNNTCRLLSIDTNLIMDKDMFFDYRPKQDKNKSDFLESLANCRVDRIGDDIDVICFSNKVGVPLKCLGPQKLFVRQFYPDLLREIRGEERNVLIGNPGIGKSFFQYYYLARILNPSLFGPLPPDCYGSTTPPKIVIRQEGTAAMTIFDIANRQAEVVNGCPGTLLDCFDPETSLYLMEPGVSVEEPHFGGFLRIPTLATVSPNPARYKEFCKNGGIAMYMPVFTLRELLAIGKYLLENEHVPELMQPEYSSEQITKRFHQFGGIFRHVLPLSLDYLNMCRRSQSEAISKCDAHALLVSGNVEDADVSHFIMQYDVERDGKFPFCNYRLNFVNESVASQVQDKLNKGSLDDRRSALIRNDERGFMADASAKIYESVIADQLTSASGVQWRKREVIASSEGKVSEWSYFSLRLNEAVKGHPPPFEEMRPLVLYVSSNPTFPFVEYMYKTEQGELVMFQVTRSKSEKKIIKGSALEQLLGKIKLPVDKVSLLRLVLIPLPSLAQNARFEVAEEGKILMNAALENGYEVWHIPRDYLSYFVE